MISFKQFVEDNLKANIGDGWEVALNIFEMRGEVASNVKWKKSDTKAKYKNFNISITDASPAISRNGVKLQFRNGYSLTDGRNTREDLAAGGVVVAALKLLGDYIEKYHTDEVVVKAKREDEGRVKAYTKLFKNTGFLGKIHDQLTDFRLLAVFDKDDFSGDYVDPDKIIFVLKKK